jgi:hypothetical protein
VKLAKKRRSDHHILQLVGQMDSELLGARVAHNYMLDVVAQNTPGAESINEVMMERRLVAAPRHSRC